MDGDGESARKRLILISGGRLDVLSADSQRLLLDAGQTRTYQTGEFTHHIGDPLGGVHGVLTGSFGVHGQNLTEGIVMGHIFRSGDWFGEGPIVRQRRRMLTFRAMEHSTTLYIPLPALERLMQGPGNLMAFLMDLVAHNSELATQAISDLLIRRADKRIAAVLLRVTGHHDDSRQATPVECAVTQLDLAEMANASRHTINTVLKKFEQSGWIRVGYGHIAVLDAAGLRRFLIAEN